ncbi:hypothetical protein CGMCC3_g10210 [Colletotrichum fructicola]|nr:uncharacterized protein CGMCC3_g10210 [Colletotrichum fructicola]KAE9573750.1 hypothetical protein CGMCC3_g10210 [Colletotrichum fructicola]
MLNAPIQSETRKASQLLNATVLATSCLPQLSKHLVIYSNGLIGIVGAFSSLLGRTKGESPRTPREELRVGDAPVAPRTSHLAHGIPFPCLSTKADQQDMHATPIIQQWTFDVRNEENNETPAQVSSADKTLAVSAGGGAIQSHGIASANHQAIQVGTEGGCELMFYKATFDTSLVRTWAD